VCILALVIRHENRIFSARHCIALSCVVSLALPYFSTLFHKGEISGKNLLNIKRVTWFYLQIRSKIFLILRRIQRDTTINMHGYSCEISFHLVTVESNFNFVGRFFKNPEISSFIKIRPVGAALFHEDRQTDMTKLRVAYQNFANTPNQDLPHRKQILRDNHLHFLPFKVEAAASYKLCHLPTKLDDVISKTTMTFRTRDLAILQWDVKVLIKFARSRIAKTAAFAVPSVQRCETVSHTHFQDVRCVYWWGRLCQMQTHEQYSLYWHMDCHRNKRA
jgi:hypothetical protein